MRLNSPGPPGSPTRVGDFAGGGRRSKVRSDEREGAAEFIRGPRVSHEARCPPPGPVGRSRRAQRSFLRPPNQSFVRQAQRSFLRPPNQSFVRSRRTKFRSTLVDPRDGAAEFSRGTPGLSRGPGSPLRGRSVTQNFGTIPGRLARETPIGRLSWLTSYDRVKEIASKNLANVILQAQ
jgi:hypothetical protein